MTVEARESRKVAYTTTGATTGPFAVDFPFFEIEVYLDGELVDAADYTISQASPGATGNVTFSVAPTGALVILGVTEREQQVDFISVDAVEPETAERALDRLTMIVQELQQSTRYTIRAPETQAEVDALDMAGNPSTIVFINADGEPVLMSPSAVLDEFDTAAGVSAAAAAASATAAASSASAAATSATAAASSASAAATSATAAASSASAAAASETAAETAETNAAASASAAATSATALASATGDMFSDVPTGVLARWHFDEANGTSVVDWSGNSKDIDLTLPTNPNTSRTGHGVRTLAGLIQTPSLTNARTVAMVYRVGRDEATGFLLSGGGSSGNGVTGEAIGTTYTTTVFNGFGVGHEPLHRNSNGSATRELNRGGWLLAFVEFNAAYTTALGFGGRHSTTTSRCAEYEIAWACAWNDQLTSDERTQVYNTVRRGLKPRGIYLSAADCPVQVDCIGLFGESNSDGRADILDLSASDQALRFADVDIKVGNSTVPSAWSQRPTRLELGLNQQKTAPTVDFGWEIGVAKSHRAAYLTTDRPLVICKLARGSTFLSTTATDTMNWNPSAVTGTSLWHAWVWMLCELEQELRQRGIGLNFRGYINHIGINDIAAGTSYVPDAATYQGWLQNQLDDLETFTGLTGVKSVLVRPPNNFAGYDATAQGYVRTAMTDFQAANSSVVTLLDTDAYTLEPDGVHYDATASMTGGAACYTALMS